MIGGATKKIQRISTLAENLYEKVNELQARAEETAETVNETSDRVARLEAELDEQRALLEAVAEEQGIDVEQHGGESTPSGTDEGRSDSPEESGGEHTT
jgi:outer membrane murein-binding lipoprotein Lpp